MARLIMTQEKIIEINELYLQIKTYAGVSRALGGSPSPTTVKKYIIPDYKTQKNTKKKIFEKSSISKDFISNDFIIENWGDLCVLSNSEKEEIKELWLELLV